MEPFAQPTFTDKRYSIIDELGRGGMGIVYRCLDNKLSKDVAVKVVAWNFTELDAVRFQKEARVLASLRHPNILSILDFGASEEGYLYIVMEILKGKSLSTVLDERKVPFDEALSIFMQICDGLSHAHHKGVLHRDIKPSNVFVEYQKNELIVTITDFGLAKLVFEDQKLTRTGVTIGSPPYMSPEQANAQAVSERSDIYSIGCLMFETLTGAPPFLADNIHEILLMHMRKAPPKVSHMVPDIVLPEKVDTIVAKCLEKEPLRRYQSTEELKKTLAQLRETQHLSESVLSGAYSLLSGMHAKVTGSGVSPALTQAPNKSLPWPLIILLGTIVGCLLTAVIIANQLMAPEPTFKELKTDEKTIDFRLDKDDKKSVGLLAEEHFKETKNKPKDKIWVTLKDNASQKLAGLGTNVQYLDLSLSNITDKDLKTLEHFKLYGLRLNETAITDKGLESASKITTLEDLCLTNCKHITDQGLTNLIRLNQLAGLSLSGTNVTDSGVTILSTLNLNNLQVLGLDKCIHLKGSTIDKLGSTMPLLGTLYLERSGLEKENLWRVTAITNNLHVLNLSGLNLNDQDLDTLTATPASWLLMQLEIRNNPAITGDGLLKLTAITTLNRVDIRGCAGINRAAIMKFHSHFPGCVLVIE